MSVSTLLPVAFPALAFAHFVALLSPGQDFFLIVAHSIRYKLKGSFFICVGIALGNGIYIAIAILGWTSIRDNSTLFTIVETLGALYLFWIGFHLVRSQKSSTRLDTEERPAPSFAKQLILGLNSALLNPKNALFYMSLMTVILGSNVTFIQQATCGIWMFTAVLIWDLVIASFIGRNKVRSYLQQSIHLIERTAGIVLILFGLGLFL